MKLPEAVDGVLIEDRAHGERLLTPPTGESLLLNATAFALWELCDGRTSTEEMALGIAELFGLDATQAEAEVERTLIALADGGLVTV